MSHESREASMRTKAEATKLGKQLVEKLRKGTGCKDWRLRVWENIGWHYEADCGPISVYPVSSEPIEDERYHTLISDHPFKCHYGALMFSEGRDTYCSKDPVKVVRRAVKRVVAVVERLNAVQDAAGWAAGI
jgi:hypothetical protein